MAGRRTKVAPPRRNLPCYKIQAAARIGRQPLQLKSRFHFVRRACAARRHSLSESSFPSLSPSVASPDGTRPIIKSPSGGGGLSLSSCLSCNRLNVRVSKKKTIAPATHIKPHAIPRNTKTNTAAAAHSAAIMQLAILNILYICLLYIPAAKKSSGAHTQSGEYGRFCQNSAKLP